MLDGDLEAISALLQRKEALIDQLNTQAPQSREDMLDLKGKLARNQELLDGALQGIRKVAARMAAVRRIRRNLETYDKSGRKSEVPGIIEHKMEKRA
ncbi:flagellar protein FlgN [Roseovarius sp. M141]|uniref:flagellar protein FlgN n=1 Tax=Roseovarius sp. M141 TaxID=2583806 RepID=UPI0020CD5485|nr:flagellar protein FlgN [Roseovarius sp. M141]